MNKKNWYEQKITEASLSRIWRDFQENEFGIITSWRVGSVDNKANLAKLKSLVSSRGFGYVRIDGVGQEEDETGKVRSVKEPSLLVKNVSPEKNSDRHRDGVGNRPVLTSIAFEKFMVFLAHKFKQWGIVLHSPEKGTRLIQTSDDGRPVKKVDMKMSKFNPMKVAQFYSSLKGKPFTFEGFKYADKPQNHIHGMSLQNKGEVDIHKRESTEKWMQEILKLTEGLLK